MNLIKNTVKDRNFHMFIYYFSFCASILILYSPSILAQTYADSSLSGKLISNITVYGNKKTKSSIILREMNHKTGDPLNPILLEEDRKRIQNLYLFNRVMILAEPDHQEVRIRIIVTEQWYLIPYPLFFINERDWGKLSYGAGLTHLNFRGRAETIKALFWLGYNPAVQLHYGNPWIAGKRNLLMQLGLYYKQVRSKHFEDDVNEIYWGIELKPGKRFGLHTFFNLIFRYEQITFSPSIPGQTLSSNGRDRLPRFGFEFFWDHRDLKEYPHKGWYMSLSTLKTGFPSSTADYFSINSDMRTYLPFGSKCTLAFRLASHLSAGTIPIYDRVYFGYGERIRGHFFEEYEGENKAQSGLAFRFPLIPIQYITLADIPGLADLKFGLSIGFFAETGLVWFQRDRIRSSMFISGYGCGLHFHLPYIDVLRLDLAFDEYGHTEWIVDLNVDI